MKEMDRLVKLLFPAEDNGSKVLDLKFFPGEQPVTVEEFCREVHSGFVQVDSGQSVASDTFSEDLVRVDVERFLASA